MAQRHRNYCTVVYPESAPDNWMQILDDLHIPALVSPLHQFDTNPTGEVKKAHYHVMVMYDNVKTMDQAKDTIAQICGVGCIVVESSRGMARYFCHLDNPEKYQYNPVEVRSFGGASYSDLVELETDRVKVIASMQDWCALHGCVSLSDLYDYARANNYEWFRALSTHCNNVMAAYLKSFAWTLENKAKVASYQEIVRKAEESNKLEEAMQNGKKEK